MYGELAGWFHLLTAPDEYADEAAEVLELLAESAGAPLETALELGTGGGNLASHLGGRLRLTLTDTSPQMLEQSRHVNTDAEHLVGDMRTLRLDRTFDAVVIHDAVGYMTTEADLSAAFETAYVHLRDGGAAIFLPDWVLDGYAPVTEHGGRDADGRGARYLEWDRDVEPDGHTVITDYIIVTRDVDGSVGVHHGEHTFGIFPRATWLRLLVDVGFEARHVIGQEGRELFVGVR